MSMTTTCRTGWGSTSAKNAESRDGASLMVAQAKEAGSNVPLRSRASIADGQYLKCVLKRLPALLNGIWNITM